MLPGGSAFDLTKIPGTSVEDQFAAIFNQQLFTPVPTTARETAAPGSFEISLDYRRDLNLRDRTALQEAAALTNGYAHIGPGVAATKKPIPAAAWLLLLLFFL